MLGVLSFWVNKIDRQRNSLVRQGGGRELCAITQTLIVMRNVTMGEEPTLMEPAIAESRGVKAPQDERILRIGIILGGNLIEETLLRKRATVTIGQSLANTFSVPIAGLPAIFPIFELVEGRFNLHFQENMDGRISLGGVVRTTSQLCQEGAVRNEQHWVYALDENSRGRISLGALTLLFQFVTPPPVAARMRLPASTRITLADRFEPRLSAIVSASVLAHLAIGIFAYTRDLVIEHPAARYARTYSVEQYVQPLPNEIRVEPQVVDEQTAGVSTTAPSTAANTAIDSENKPKRNRANKNNGPTENKKKAPSQAAIDETIDDTVVVSVLSGLAGPDGVLAEMRDKDQSADLDKSLHLAKRKKASTAVAFRDRHRDRISDDIGEDTGEQTSDLTDTELTNTTKKEEEIQAEPPRVGKVETWDDTDVDPAAVAKRVRKRYLAGIRRCHQRALIGNAEAHGKVVVEFTIGPTGRVIKAAATGFDARVDKCIESIAARWRFTGPKSDGKPTSASYSIPLLLKKPRS